MKQSMHGARWRKEPSEKGLARITQRARGLQLTYKGRVAMRVASVDRHGGNWYWYGLGVNTLNPEAMKTWPTMEEAKADATKYWKSQSDPPPVG